MKKFILTVLVLLIVGFTQFANTQGLAPAPKPAELVFFPNNKAKTIMVYQRFEKDLKLQKEVIIPKELLGMDHGMLGGDDGKIALQLNNTKDSFVLKTIYLGDSVIPGEKWYHQNKIKKEYKSEGIYFNRETLTFQAFSVSFFEVVNSVNLRNLFIFIFLIGGCCLFLSLLSFMFLENKMKFKKRMILSSFLNIFLLIFNDAKLYNIGLLSIPIVVVVTVVAAVLIYNFFYFEEE